MSSDRWGQEVPTLFEESARVQHGQLAGSSSDMCEHSASDRGGQEVPTLLEQSVRQSACVSSGRGGQEVPTLFEESAWVQCSQLAVCIFSFRPWGVGGEEVPTLFEGSVKQSTCMSSGCGGQEAPTLFEESAWVQCSQPACVYLQLQTVGVRKSRPFLKNQQDSQFACRQTVGVRKSRPFLKNQHAFNTVSLQVPLQPQTVLTLV